MNKVKKSNTSVMEVTLQVINWNQYFNGIIRERVSHVVTEYIVQTSYDPIEIQDTKSEPSLESSYERNYHVVEEIENPSEKIREQLLKQLTSHKVDYKILAHDFQTSVEEAMFKAMEKFVDIDHCVIVCMGEKDGYEHYMLAPTTREDLVIRLLNFSQGAVVVYKPKAFTLFKVKTP